MCVLVHFSGGTALLFIMLSRKLCHRREVVKHWSVWQCVLIAEGKCLGLNAASPVSDWLRRGELKCVKWGGNHFLVGADRWHLSALCRPGVVYTRNWQSCSLRDQVVNILDSAGQTFLLQLCSCAFALRWQWRQRGNRGAWPCVNKHDLQNMVLWVSPLATICQYLV